MTTFTVYTQKTFNDRVKTLKNRFSDNDERLQELLKHAVFHGITTRKPHYAENLVAAIPDNRKHGITRKIIIDMIVSFVPCLRTVTDNDIEKNANLNGRVFTVVSGTKPLDTAEKKQAAIDQANEVISKLPCHTTYKKETPPPKVNPVDPMAVIDRMLTRALGTKNKPGAGFSDEKTAEALLSFLPSIKAGINQSDLLSDLNAAIDRLKKENDALKAELKTRKPLNTRNKQAAKLAA